MNWKAIAAAGVLALAAGSANATVTFYSYGVGAPSLPVLDNFSSDTANSAPASSLLYSWVSSGTKILNPALSGTNGAEPAFSATTHDTGNYLSVLHGGTATITLVKPSSLVEIYIGSLDGYNTLSFGGVSPSSFTGTQLATYSGADNGNQTAANTNGLFEFSFAKPVDSITFQSTTNSFEVASIYAPAAVPEPATWAMMLMGFFGLGAVIRSTRRNTVANAAV